jgi:peptidyl-prolyl cis-trans isomerase SurA
MKRLLPTAFLALLATAPIWAQEPTKIDQIAARVNNTIILKSDIDRKLESIGQELAGAIAEKKLTAEDAVKYLAEAKETVLQELIDTALLVQLAKENDENADLEVLKTMERLLLEHKDKYPTMADLERAIIKDYGDLEEFKNTIRENVLSEKAKQRGVYSRIVITEEEMRKFYEEHKKEFDKPAGVTISEIAVLIDKRFPDQVATQRKKIEEAMAALKKGDAFDEVARKFSEVQNSVDGGHMGFFSNELHEDIQKAIAPLAKGQITEIVELGDAFEIYKVTDKHTGGILSFELARGMIGRELMEVAAPPKVREFLTELRRDGFVDVKEGFKDAGAIPPKPKSTVPTKP